MTYTRYKLTDAQLRRLSALCNPAGGGAKGGVACDALARKGLVRTILRPHTLGNGKEVEVFDRNEPTEEGRKALAAARREGW